MSSSPNINRNTKNKGNKFRIIDKNNIIIKII